MKAVEQAEKNNTREDVINYLNKAKEALEKVEKLEIKNVNQNLKNINLKLNNYHNISKF